MSKVDPQAIPVLLVALRSRESIREVTELADKRVRRQIESISGVGQVTIIGGRARQIHVRMDPVKLRAYNLSAVDVERALVAQNLATPGGSVDTGPQAITLRIAGRVTTVEGLGRMDAETGGRPAELYRFRREVLGARPVSGLALPLLRD